MRKRYLFTIGVALSLIVISTAVAGIPRLIAYQGLLTDISGTPVADGTYDIIFSIYADSTTGSSEWSEIQSVTTTSGSFNVQLGQITLLDEVIFDSFTNLFIGLQLSGEAEMTPRTRLTSTGFCYRALHADQADYAAVALFGGGWKDDGAVVRLDTGTDNVGIGTSTPVAKLDIDGDVVISGKTTFGSGHTNTGSSATICGGSGNIASADLAVIGGGDANTANSDGTTISGGQGNTASGMAATVGGGVANHALAPFTTIGGGGPANLSDPLNTNNKAYDQYCTIGGGAGNRVGIDN